MEHTTKELYTREHLCPHIPNPFGKYGRWTQLPLVPAPPAPSWIVDYLSELDWKPQGKPHCGVIHGGGIESYEIKVTRAKNAGVTGDRIIAIEVYDRIQMFDYEIAYTEMKFQPLPLEQYAQEVRG